MGSSRPVQKGLGPGGTKEESVPLNVLLPSKVPLKVEFVVLSMVGGCCCVVSWYCRFYRSFLLLGCAPGVRLLLVCRFLTMRACQGQMSIFQKSRSFNAVYGGGGGGCCDGGEEPFRVYLALLIIVEQVAFPLGPTTWPTSGFRCGSAPRV